MNEAILKKVQNIYGAPSMESVNVFNEESHDIELDETPALEAYSEEELELLHNELVEDYTNAMEQITPELANLELTITLESVGLSLDRFNEYEGELSMEGVKKAIKAGKVNKDSAFNSIIKRIVNLFWSTIDNITGNTVKVLKYAKLLKKYSDKLDAVDVSKINAEAEIAVGDMIRDTKPLEKFVKDNNAIYTQVAKFSGMITPKAVVAKVYGIFSSIGINPQTEDFTKQFETLLESYKTAKGETSTIKKLSSAVEDARKQAKEYINIINSLKFGNIREKLTNAKKKMIAELERQKKAEEDTTKKEAIQADLDRLMKLFTAYKSYNKKVATAINNDLASLVKNIGKILDASKNAAKTTSKEETK